jgi:hypothetical protein
MYVLEFMNRPSTSYYNDEKTVFTSRSDFSSNEYNKIETDSDPCVQILIFDT